MSEGTCKTCGAKILWVKMAKTGKANPLNAEPDPVRGNVRILLDCAEVLSGPSLEDARDNDDELYLSHFATCPQNKQHRKPA